MTAEVKVGDPYTCSVTVTNTGSSDSPASVFDSLADSKAGNLLGTANVGTTITANTCKTAGTPVTLLPGASCTVTYDRVTLISDSDPIINTATVHMHPTGFPNDLTAQDQATIDVFQPGITLVTLDVTKPADVAAALAVAIPATFGYNIFANKLNRFDGALEGFGSEIIALMAREGRI